MPVRAGAAAPEALRLPCNGPAGIDMSLVIAATIEARRPYNTIAIWVPTIFSASLSQVVLQHVFSADGLDVPIPGIYPLFVRLIFPDGVRRPDRYDLPVVAW